MRKIYRYILLLIVAVGCSSQVETDYRWKKEHGNWVLMDNGVKIATLRACEEDLISHKERIESLDSDTWKVTCTFKALEDLDSARLDVRFTHLSKSPFWMIPSVSYNGNDWGKGKEPKGAKQDGEWRTVSFRRTPIPGAMYSEGDRYTLATWAEAPGNIKENFSCSIQPDEAETRHVYLWPEEEMPLRYVNRDRFGPGSIHWQPLRKGETVVLQLFVHVSPLKDEHRAMHSFLRKAWELAPKPQVDVYSSDKLWDLGIRYAKESLWAEEGDFKGFSIGLLPTPDGKWKQRGGGKYEIGWCGQNASFAISLLKDYLKNGSEDSLEKGIATLDTWSRCSLPNGLFIVRYDEPLNTIDACNLGTAAVNFFEACDVAKECGIQRPEYERIAYRICDFVMADQQENGCYAKGWKPDGTCVYREGTVGCFLVPAMIEAYRRSDDKRYLSSAERAYRHYLKELKNNGFSTAGALDTWCIDKESSISLLRSAMRLYSLSGSPEYLEDALDVSWYLSTWLWHYDGVYPEDDDFSEYGYHTFGATSVSVQHNHLDPYALYWVPEWIELAELTGDGQWREKAFAIWRNGNQLVSDGTLEINGLLRPAGSQNEAYFECDWGFGASGAYNKDGQSINNWLVAWPGAFRMETIRRLDGRIE